MSTYCLTPNEQFFSYISLDEILMMMSTLYWANMLSWPFIVLPHWNNSLQEDMLLHSDTLFWFWANDRHITHLGETNISFALFNIFSYFLYQFCDIKLHYKYKRSSEDILNRTKDIATSQRWVICLYLLTGGTV